MKKLIFVMLMIFAVACCSGYSYKVEAASKPLKLSSIKKNTTFTYNGLGYKVTRLSGASGEVICTGAKKNKKNVVIPASVTVSYSSGKVVLKVTDIQSYAFCGKTKLTKLTIGKNVKNIGEGAFSSCTNLKNVELKKNSRLKTIESRAFQFDGKLQNINFNNAKKFESYEDDAFDYCIKILKKLPKNKKASIVKLIKQAEKYEYTIEPIVAPLDTYFFVRTKNKDMKNIRFKDISCKKGEYSTDYCIVFDNTTYIDVKYDNKKEHRVNGGYIYVNKSSKYKHLDGGKFRLQIVTDDMDGYYYEGGVIDTDIIIDVPKVQGFADYVADKCFNKKDSFDKNMERATNTINDLFIRKINVRDSSKYLDNKVKYPFVDAQARSQAVIYEPIDGELFAYKCYPISVDNEQDVFTELIRKMDTKSPITYDWFGIVRLKKNNKEYVYNAKKYDNQTEFVYKKYVKNGFTFKDDVGDFAGMYSISLMKRRLEQYIEKTKVHIDKMKEQADNSQCYKNLGHSTWIKLYYDGYKYKTQGSEYANYDCGYSTLANCWVDGRYVGVDGRFVKGEKFEDHKTDFLIRNMTFKNKAGRTITGDVYFSYCAQTNDWRSGVYDYDNYFKLGGFYNFELDKRDVPEEFIYTYAEVKAMNLDKNTDKDPTDVVLFDGTVPPGTRKKRK